MMSRRALLCLTLIAVAGCRTPVRQLSGSAAAANMVSDPLDHTVYQGSDDRFYYFERFRFKTSDRFKVARDEIDLPANVRIGDIPVGLKFKYPTTSQKPE